MLCDDTDKEDLLKAGRDLSKDYSVASYEQMCNIGIRCKCPSVNLVKTNPSTAIKCTSKMNLYILGIGITRWTTSMTVSFIDIPAFLC